LGAISGGQGVAIQARSLTMSVLPVLVIGYDPGWRARMQRLLAARGELDWLGAYAPAHPRHGDHGPPALLLLDGDDPTIERARRRPLLPPPRRLYFYRRPDVAALLRCIASRANACLDKLAPPDMVLRAIRAAESDLFVTMPDLLLRALRDNEAAPALAVAAGVDFTALTRRQREIVRWAARGMSNKQIARQLGISPETVKTHLHHVFEREGVHNRVALLALHHDAETPQGDG
jgi:DNA-binding NarL/FixJ family response regulator